MYCECLCVFYLSSLNEYECKCDMSHVNSLPTELGVDLASYKIKSENYIGLCGLTT